MRHRLWRVSSAVLVLVVSVALLAAAVAVSDRLRPTRTDGWIVPANQLDVESSPASTPLALPRPHQLRRSAAAPGSGPLGLKWSWVQPETFRFVAAAAGGWTFGEVEWCDVEPRPGRYDWTMVDRWVRESRRLGHEPMLKLRTGQCWATAERRLVELDPTENVTKEPSTPPTDLAAYLAFVRATVQRYVARGVTDYAVENEPDVPNSWSGTLGEYAALARRVAPVIHRAAPQARVLDGGVSSSAYGVVLAAANLDRDPERALADYQAYYARRIEGGRSRFPWVGTVAELQAVVDSTPGRRALRAVAVSLRLVNSGRVDGYQLHYYESSATLPAVLRYLDRRLDHGVPVEAWEVGVAWPGEGYDAVVAAQEVFRRVGDLLAAGVRRVLYLPVAYSPAPGKIQVFRGLVEPTGQLLPVGGGWLELARSLAGLRDGDLRPARGGLEGAAWQAGRRQAALVRAPGEPVTLDAADVARVVDATGATLRGAPVVGSEPVLVIGSAGGDLVRAVGGRRD